MTKSEAARKDYEAAVVKLDAALAEGDPEAAKRQFFITSGLRKTWLLARREELISGADLATIAFPFVND